MGAELVTSSLNARHYRFQELAALVKLSFNDKLQIWRQVLRIQPSIISQRRN